MNVIIDVNHPGHVHLFKNFAKMAEKDGWKVMFTAKDKEVTLDLLKADNLNYKCLGKHYSGKLGKIFSLFYHVFRLFWISLFFRVDVFLSHGSVPASWVSFLLRRKYISFEDTGNMEQIRLYKPFAHTIFTTESFRQDYGKIQVRYKGFHEIAYLHPDYFKPNKDIYSFLGIDESQKYFILRFVSWGASHDVGQKGLKDTDKEEIVKLLAKHGNVFISSEAGLPNSLLKYKIKIPADKMHDALAFAHFFVGEGATMASECAMLGTPAVYINSMIAETIDEQQDYGLLYHFTTSEGVISKINELIDNKNLTQEWQQKRMKLLNDKIDVSAFTYWYVKNYPESLKTMKDHPDFQEKFATKAIPS